jgi:hypothetical protein
VTGPGAAVDRADPPEQGEERGKDGKLRHVGCPVECSRHVLVRFW